MTQNNRRNYERVASSPVIQALPVAVRGQEVKKILEGSARRAVALVTAEGYPHENPSGAYQAVAGIAA